MKSAELVEFLSVCLFPAGEFPFDNIESVHLGHLLEHRAQVFTRSHMGNLCRAHPKFPDSQKESRHLVQTTLLCKEFSP